MDEKCKDCFGYELCKTITDEKCRDYLCYELCKGIMGENCKDCLCYKICKDMTGEEKEKEKEKEKEETNTKNARWVNDGTHDWSDGVSRWTYVCSECGAKAPISIHIDWHSGKVIDWHHDALTNYCPNCGAKMNNEI